jgi:diadenosine tetraphosphate (Ap4A) HIT family hydrolase
MRPCTTTRGIRGVTDANCAICAGPARDGELDRVEVWRDDLWRLSMSQHGPTVGFAYLEPLRHIPSLADLDGPEADTFGAAIARASAVLREASGARLVYAYVFGGGIPHLHVHLAPNQPEGVLNTALINGPIKEHRLPSGATEIISQDHPDLPEEEVAAVVERARELMTR